MNAKQLRDSILQYAFQGKLVNPIDVSEKAIKLVEAIIDERNKLIKEKIIKKVKISTIKDTDYLWDIPEHWVWERAANVLDVRDGTHDTPKYVSEGIPLVTSKNLNNGDISFESAKFISMEDHLAIEQRSKVDNDDILFAMIGTIGNPVLVKKHRDFSVKNVGIFKSYPVNKVNMKYILYFLTYMENIIKKNASGGVQAFISLSGLRDIMIPIAPIKEQNEIVSKIEKLLEKVNHYDKLFVQLEKHNMNPKQNK
ncbi:restriction endonuclease subunit S [Solibacillus cecembensis]|uniref:restriction endonuclease subunit S n=1 Tax=Solibacillus cecembensis TaxID=459347 RepID=UPI003D03A31F